MTPLRAAFLFAVAIVGVLVLGFGYLLLFGGIACGCSPAAPGFTLGEPDVFEGRAYFPIERTSPGTYEELARVDTVRVSVGSLREAPTPLDFTRALPGPGEWTLWTKGAQAPHDHLVVVGDRLDVPEGPDLVVESAWDIVWIGSARATPATS